jgi:hypothetical protein
MHRGMSPIEGGVGWIRPGQIAPRFRSIVPLRFVRRVDAAPESVLIGTLRANFSAGEDKLGDADRVALGRSSPNPNEFDGRIGVRKNQRTPNQQRK